MGCCKPVLHGWFWQESLYKIGLRHTGPTCAGQIDALSRGAWFWQGRHLKTGEAYQ